MWSPTIQPKREHILESTVNLCKIKAGLLASRKDLTSAIRAATGKVIFLQWQQQKISGTWFNRRTGRLCTQCRVQVRGYSIAARTWSRTYGFAKRGLSVRSMAIQVLCEAVEFRIQAAVHRNSVDHTAATHASLVKALGSSNSSTLHKAYNEFKPRTKRRRKRLVAADGKVPANDRE